jgi:hypothetical protein
VRALLFPVAQRQFASMASMRKVQPKMKALQERYKDDKPALQQEMMQLYQTEKVNPLGGLPADLHPDADLHRALQSAVAVDRDAPPAVRALWIQRSVRRPIR